MNIPYSWASPEVDSLIKDESSKLKQARDAISERFGLSCNKIAREDLTYVAMPEILSGQYCVLSGNEHLLTISPPLQAFLAYAISIYDTIADHHLYKDGKPTFLKTYGKDSVLSAGELYREAISKLSKELEKEVCGATRVAEEMYLNTIKWDKLRNSKIFSPRKTLLLQNKLVGEHAYNVAVLSNARELGNFSSCLVNAITTLEDLIDLFHGEDFTGKKTTIPISLLVDEFGFLIQDYEAIKKSRAIQRTKEYIMERICSSKRMLNRYDSKKTLFLSKIIDAISDFNGRFLAEYL